MPGEEEYVIEVRDDVVVDPLLKDFVSRAKSPFSYSPTEPGSGALIGFKMAQKILEAPIVVLSGSLSGLADYEQPFNAVVAENAAATALALARYNSGVLAFAGDGFTLQYFPALIAAAKKNADMIYICYNNGGYSALRRQLELNYFSRMIGTGYVASASISHPEDYIKKLNKAREAKGFRFIDLFVPSPSLSGFAPSESVHVARAAVETGIWPLFEKTDGKREVTLRLPRLEPVERYFELVSHKPDEEKMKAIQEKVTKNWKTLLA